MKIYIQKHFYIGKKNTKKIKKLTTNITCFWSSGVSVKRKFFIFIFFWNIYTMLNFHLTHIVILLVYIYYISSTYLIKKICLFYVFLNFYIILWSRWWREPIHINNKRQVLLMFFFGSFYMFCFEFITKCIFS